MTPERWQQIDQLYHQALEYKANERLVFVRQACGNDQDLHRELEMLLEAHDRAGGFLSAALAGAAAAAAPPAEISMTGQTISHYRILEKVGGGGMGA
jgi:hypothetical protein